MKSLLLLVPVLYIFCFEDAADGLGRGSGSRAYHRKIQPDYRQYYNRNNRPRSARIVRASHFYQAFKLGYKIKLICIVEGDPLPHVKWFKNHVELDWHKRNLHVSEIKQNNGTRRKSKIEIDPATVGDQGIYKCTTNNRYGSDKKEFKTEYYF